MSAQSVLPLPHRRISAAGRSLGCICGSAPTQTPPRPIGVLSARYWRCWYPEPRRSGCHSSHRQSTICQPSAEYAPSSTTARDACPAWIKSSSCTRSSALNRTTYFLTATSFVATNHLRHWVATTVIQNTPSNNKPDREHVRHRSASNGPIKGMSFEQDRSRHDLQAHTSRREKLASSPRPQPVAESHPWCKVHRRNRGRQIASSNRCRLTLRVTKIRR